MKGGEQMNKLSNFIREKRLDEALTQQQFADIVGITNVTLSNLENGRPVGSKTIKKLSDFTGVPTKTLRRLMNENEDNK